MAAFESFPPSLFFADRIEVGVLHPFFFRGENVEGSPDHADFGPSPSHVLFLRFLCYYYLDSALLHALTTHQEEDTAL